ncbi:MAG: hypothetical protein K6F32_01360 [Bacilli bacterium]|nr:hypothetical protein [Bacilli bacterium]
MDDGFENPNIDEIGFKADGYLSPSQQEIASAKNAEIKRMGDQIALVNLIDGFVRSNGKADEKYLNLYESLSKLGDLFAHSGDYPSNVADTIPFSYAMVYFSYLVLTGVISEKDIEEMKARSFGAFPQPNKIAKA